MPNMRDIAKAAGVSVGTVSLALRDNTRISADTRAHIQAIAREYGYLPNRLSQALITGKSRTLGFVIHRHFGPLYAHIMGSVLEHAARNNYTVMVQETQQTEEAVTRVIRTLLEHRVEGIIIALPGLMEPIHGEALLAIHSAGVYFVTISETSSALAATDLVLTDLEAVLRLSIVHLWQLGHREVAFLGIDTPLTNQCYKPLLLRMMKQYGLTTERVQLLSNHEEIAATLAQWWRHPHRPTAILATNDWIATSIIFNAGSLGIRVPQELCVAGCGNFFPNIHPKLTTVERYPRLLGQEAVNLILQRLDDQIPPADCAWTIRRIEPMLLNGHTAVPITQLTQHA